MQRRTASISPALALICALTAGAAAANDLTAQFRAATVNPRARGVMVAFRPETSHTQRVAALQRAGLQPDLKTSGLHFARVRTLNGLEPVDQQAFLAAKKLQQDPAVRVAEPDYTVRGTAVPNDPRFSDLWGLNNTGQSGGTSGVDIGALSAWSRGMGTGKVVVAVIDTGVDYNHPDLRDNILRDGNNQVVGWDFANNDADPMDDNEHGTHCAGTIGASANNGIGVVGVCPNVKIMPLKFLTASGDGDTSNAIKCIDWAVQHGAQILSNSWGGGGQSQLLYEAIQRARAAGVLFVAAAGNDALNNDESASFPANYNAQLDNVISVAATDRNDSLASFSDYGATSVDIAAPGVQILSTVPNGQYAFLSGTSMATPHVAGAAALIKSCYPNLTAAQIKARLLYNAVHPAGLNGKVAAGRLNLNLALGDDANAPGTPANFMVSRIAGTGMLLSWTASGDDGDTGSASNYELRYSTSPITEANFDAAAAASGLPTPAGSGTAQQYCLGGLKANTSYYLALRAMDKGGNVSPPALLGPVLTPTAAKSTYALEDTVEGARQFSGTSGWGVTTQSSSSPSHSYTDSPGGNYANNTDSALIQNAAVTVTGAVPQLTFMAKASLEDGWDYLYVELSTDGGASWRRQPLALTGHSAWQAYSVSLAPFYGQSVLTRFRLVTDDQGTDDGVWVDDIRIGGEPLQVANVTPPPPAGSAPNAPANVAAVAQSRAQVQLSWTEDSKDVSGFKIERRTGSGAYQQVAVLGSGATSWGDVKVQAGGAYSYRLRATNTAGDSAYSAEASVTVPDVPPTTPTSISAAAANGQVTVRWNPVAAATSYNVRRSVSAAGPFTLVANVSAPVYVDTAVTNGVTYYYGVTAVNSGGESGTSSVVSATPKAPVTLSAPTRLRVSAGTRKITLRWTQGRGGVVSQNRIYRASVKGGQYAPVATIKATTSYVDKITVSGTYYYVVTALDAQGNESPRSNEAGLKLRVR